MFRACRVSDEGDISRVAHGDRGFEVRARPDLDRRAAEADVVVVSGAHVIDAAALGVMKPGAYLVNVAQGGCVDEAALIAALRAGRIAGAALDCTDPEPPSAESPLWTMPDVLLTPHTGGETTRYEANVIEILLENLDRLWRGEAALRNQII